MFRSLVSMRLAIVVPFPATQDANLLRRLINRAMRLSAMMMTIRESAAPHRRSGAKFAAAPATLLPLASRWYAPAPDDVLMLMNCPLMNVGKAAWKPLNGFQFVVVE